MIRRSAVLGVAPVLTTLLGASACIFAIAAECPDFTPFELPVSRSRQKTVPALGDVSVAAAQLVDDPALSAPQLLTESQLRTLCDLPFPYVKSRQAVRANGSPRGGPYLIFTLSGRRGRADAYTLEATRALAASAFAVYGGAEALARCARDYFATR